MGNEDKQVDKDAIRKAIKSLGGGSVDEDKVKVDQTIQEAGRKKGDGSDQGNRTTSGSGNG